MTCHLCADASVKLHHEFLADCAGCRARAVARSRRFSDACKSGTQGREYRATLVQCQVTHAEAVAAAQADRGCDKLLQVGEQT